MDGTEPESDPALVDLLCDDVARRALHVADGEAVSAKELADRCDVSEPTIYRKVNAMESADIIATGTRIERDGNHVTVYENNVERIEVTYEPDGDDLTIEVVHRRPADRFKSLWEGLRER